VRRPIEGEEEIAQTLRRQVQILGMAETACESAERSAKLKQLTTKRTAMMK